MTVSNQEITLGEMFTAEVVLERGVPDAVQIHTLHYFMERVNGGSKQPVNDPYDYLGSVNLYSVFPGRWRVGAWITYCNNHTQSGWKDTIVYIETRHVFPTAEKILAGKVQGGQTVQSRMDAAWTETCNRTTTMTYQEVGFNIYIVTSTTESYYECTFEYGEAVPYDSLPDITLSALRDKSTDFTLSSGGRYYVGEFHTHPPLWNWALPAGTIGRRETGPSSNDHPHSSGIPRWVYDFIGNQGIDNNGNVIQLHLSSDSQNSSITITNFGGNQRILNEHL